jgi:nicotinamidase-related amidase
MAWDTESRMVHAKEHAIVCGMTGRDSKYNGYEVVVVEPCGASWDVPIHAIYVMFTEGKK